MRVTQKSVRAFHCQIKNDEEFFNYFRKNIETLKNYLITLSGEVSENILQYLKKENICFLQVEKCNEKILNITQKIKEEKLNPKIKKESLTDIKEKKVKVYDRSIRSGEEIVSFDDLIISGRVNSGAEVRTTSNLIITGKIDGVVECAGRYMILNQIDHGAVYFNQEAIQITNNNSLKLVYSKDESLVIKELI